MAARFADVPERIIATAKRLKKVQIECRPAQEVIPEYKSREVLIYADPPYVLGSRTGGRVYAHEMTNDEHVGLLKVLNEHPGPVVLSGYDCELYRSRLIRWSRKTKRQTTQQGVNKEESLWLNPVATEFGQQSLFEE